MDRRKPARVSGIPGLEGFERRRTVAHLADDDPVGPHAQGVADQVDDSDRDGMPTREGGDQIPGGTLEFGRVFDQENTIIRERRLSE